MTLYCACPAPGRARALLVPQAGPPLTPQAGLNAAPDAAGAAHIQPQFMDQAAAELSSTGSSDSVVKKTPEREGSFPGARTPVVTIPLPPPRKISTMERSARILSGRVGASGKRKE